MKGTKNPLTLAMGSFPAELFADASVADL